MSYVNIICSNCNAKHEVSSYFLKTNNKSLDELAKSICSCQNIIVQEKIDHSYESNLFLKKIDKIIQKNIFVYSEFKEDKIKIYSVYNYVPEYTLNFRYFNEFDKAVKIAENELNQFWDKKHLLLKYKCQENLKNHEVWSSFNFFNKHTIDHDNSYLILRALKNKDPFYLEFLAQRLLSVLETKNKITFCRIPSSNKDNEGGCRDIIKIISKNNRNFIDGSNCIQRIKSIPSAHKSNLRDKEIHLATSKLVNPELLDNYDVLLIDDIMTTGNSIAAYCNLIYKNSNPKSLTVFIFGITTR